jgi:hypothetical protein
MRNPAVEVLADGPLAGLALVGANRPVVEYRVAGDHLEPPIRGHVARAPPHHRDQLRLVVQLLADARADQRLAVRDQGAGSAHEEGRVLRPLVPAFLGVVRIVQPQAQDLSGPGNRQPVAHPGGVDQAVLARVVHRLGEATHALGAGGQQADDVPGQARRGDGEVDEPLAAARGEHGLVVVFDDTQAHGAVSPGSMRRSDY